MYKVTLLTIDQGKDGEKWMRRKDILRGSRDQSLQDLGLGAGDDAQIKEYNVFTRNMISTQRDWMS